MLVNVPFVLVVSYFWPAMSAIEDSGAMPSKIQPSLRATALFCDGTAHGEEERTPERVGRKLSKRLS